MKLKIFILMFLLLPNIILATEVSTFEDLKRAINNNEENITITNDIEIVETLTINANIVIDGNKTIRPKQDLSSQMFIISKDVSLTLKNITIDGNNPWTWKSEEDRLDPLKTSTSDYLNKNEIIYAKNIIETSGNLYLENITIQNFYLSSDNEIFMIKSTNNGTTPEIVFNNTKIINNYATIMQANSSILKLENNTLIENNYCYGNKGGVFQLFKTTATMENTNIINNLGRARSGTIFGVINQSMLTMNSGKIDNNISKYHGSASTGSMITLEGGGGFEMNGGSISNNVGTLASAISSRWTNTVDSGDKKIILNNGIIQNNTTSHTSWNNADVFLRSAAIINTNMTINGDIVVNNTNASLENNGIINGTVYLNDSTASSINNGTIENLNVTKGTFTNNNVINNVYEKDVKIENNGTITNTYISDITQAEGKYQIYFNLNGGKTTEDGYSEVKRNYEENYDFKIENDGFELSREGYQFDKWYTDQSMTTEYINSPVTQNMTLYAGWIPNQYDVIFDVDGNQTIIKMNYEEKIVLPKKPTKKDHKFIGWEGYTKDMTVPLNGITFKAKWEIINPKTLDRNINLFIVIVFVISMIAYLIVDSKNKSITI